MEERRKHHRQNIRSGIIALIQDEEAHVAKIQDISENGLSFFYNGPTETFNNIEEVDILLMDGDIFWSHVPCSIIASQEYEAEPELKAIQNIHRCSVRFASLKQSQLQDLKKLFKHEKH